MGDTQNLNIWLTQVTSLERQFQVPKQVRT